MAPVSVVQNCAAWHIEYVRSQIAKGRNVEVGQGEIEKLLYSVLQCHDDCQKRMLQAGTDEYLLLFGTNASCSVEVNSRVDTVVVPDEVVNRQIETIKVLAHL